MEEKTGDDSAEELESFDHYARLLRRVLRVPTALVTIVEAHRQVFPGVLGIPEPYLSSRQSPLSYSFCQYVVEDGAPLIIADARQIPRVKDNLAIEALHVIAYAGWPLFDEGGRAIGSLCAIDSAPREWTTEELEILEDLALACSAERQQSHRVVKDSENLARIIFASAEVAMAFYDVDQRLVLANQLAERAAEIAGFRLDQPPHAGVDVRHSDNQTPVPLGEQVIPRALRGELSQHEMEWFGPPGNQLALITSSHRVLRGDGSPWGTLIVAHDVTDLARSIQVKGEFIATVSHELRTPLTSVIGYVEVLAEGLNDPDGSADTLKKIERGALRLQARVNELMNAPDFRRRLDLQSTDIAQVAHRVSATFSEQASAAGIQLSVHAGQPHWAVVDAGRLEQALENVVSNALKYTARGGHVTLIVGGDDQAVEIAVADDGSGMSRDEVAQACDSFWRAASAHRSAVQGIGIGLTLVRDIVNAHHGSLDIASHPGRGTTVTLSVPRIHQP